MRFFFNKTTTALFFFLFSGFNFFSQDDNKIYFNRIGKSVSIDLAYYYRVKQPTNDQYKSFYISNDSIYFIGRIISADNTDEAKNKYMGTCFWYFKNGKKKAERFFNNDGLEEGKSVYYFESGALWKEIVYSKGKALDNKLIEFSEDGSQSTIFEENFSNNNADWDLYNSDKSNAEIKDGAFILTSYTKDATSRFISVMDNSIDFTFEAVLNNESVKEGAKSGLLYGFRDWQNYNFFYISNNYFFIGYVYEGSSTLLADGKFSGAIKKGNNKLKVIVDHEKSIFSINSETQFTTESAKTYGGKLGFGCAGESKLIVDQLLFKKIDRKKTEIMPGNSNPQVITGKGLFISSDGLILTSSKAIEKSTTLYAEVSYNGIISNYEVELIQKDKENDVAILKVKDSTFKTMDKLAYAFKEIGGIELESIVYSIRPFSVNQVRHVERLEGKVISKTGNNGAINSFQTTIPLKESSSGAPIFNSLGQLIGITNSTEGNANVIKLNYIISLIDVMDGKFMIPSDNSITNASTQSQIDILAKYLVVIKKK